MLEIFLPIVRFAGHALASAVGFVILLCVTLIPIWVGKERTMKVVKILWQAFVESFKEGLGLFFSPFTGFWHAIGNLRIPSMVHGIFKSGEKGAAQH